MIPYTLIRADRRTISIRITEDGQVIVRCPRRMGKREADAFVESMRSWIERHLQAIPPRQAPLTPEELTALATRAKAVIPRRAAHFAALVGVTYGRITIRSQRSRWGSCSAKGNLNFNCLLMLCPPEVLDYVVVHELCHRRELNHSAAFWAEVERVLPGYRTQKAWLKENGAALIRRLPKE